MSDAWSKVTDFLSRHWVAVGAGAIVVGGVAYVAKEVFFPTPVFDGEKHVSFDAPTVEDMSPELQEIVKSIQNAGLEGKFKRGFVMKLYSEFARRAEDLDGRTVLSYKSFAKLMEEHMGVTDTTVIQKAFSVWDADNSGYVDFSELLQALAFAAEGSEVDKLQLMFKSFDLNGDGVISKDEMMRFLKAMFKIINEPRTDAQIRHHVQQLFATFDVDQSNSLTIDEFVKMGRMHNFLLEEDLVKKFTLYLQSSVTSVLCK